MNLPSITSIIIIVFLILGVWFIQYFKNRKITRLVRLIVEWHDFVLSKKDNPDKMEEERLSGAIEKELSRESIGGSVMFFSTRFKKSFFGESVPEGKNIDELFKRFVQWEGKQVRLDVFWTLIHGTYLKYVDYLERGEHLDFSAISNPVSVLRKYWGV